jgi:excinuclease ABC subunit B
MERAIGSIEAELEQRLAEMERQGKLLEAQRLRMRTTYDIEMMRQVGSCSGIENYSRHIDGRGPGTRPEHAAGLLPRGLLLVIDESHVTVPQIGACTRATCPASGCSSTTASGCPSAMDNRPAEVGGVPRADRADGVPVRDPGHYELAAARRGRADHPARPA